MGCSIITTFFLTLGVYIILHHNSAQCTASSSDVVSAGGGNLDASERLRGHNRPMLMPRASNLRLSQYMRNRLPPAAAEPQMIVDDLLVDDDDEIDLSKRQSEDYGHMRFGKRGGDLGDDYGHLRFGRSLEDE